MVSCFVVYAHEENAGHPNREKVVRLVEALKKQERSIQVISDHIAAGQVAHFVTDYNHPILPTNPTRVDYVIVVCTKTLKEKSENRGTEVWKELGLVMDRIATESQVIHEHKLANPIADPLKRSVFCVLLDGKKEEVVPDYLFNKGERIVYSDLQAFDSTLDHQVTKLCNSMQVKAAERALTQVAYRQMIPAQQIISNLPEPNRLFVGRKEPLKQLREQLQNNYNKPMVIVGNMRDSNKVPEKSLTDVPLEDAMAELKLNIHGMGGVGKTQLAKRYAQACLHGESGYAQYKLLWWIDTKDRTRLESDYARLAKELKVATMQQDGKPSNPRQIIKEVHKQLARTSHWLLVFDDVQDPQDLTEWLPDGLPDISQGNGHILLTSRCNRLGSEILPMPLDVFSLEEALELMDEVFVPLEDLLDISFRDTTKALRLELAEAVGRHPLALAQAIGYVKENSQTTLRAPLNTIQRTQRHNAGLQQYIHDFKEKRAVLMQTQPAKDGTIEMYQYTVRTSVELSIAKISKYTQEHQAKLKAAGILGLSCLDMSSCLASGWFPLNYFNPLVGPLQTSDQPDLENAITLLDRYHLLEKELATLPKGERQDKAPEEYEIPGASFHEMTLAVLWDRLSQDKQASALAQATEAMAEIFKQQTHSPKMQYVWKQGLAHTGRIVEYVRVIDRKNYLPMIRDLMLLCNSVSDRCGDIAQIREQIWYLKALLELGQENDPQNHLINIAKTKIVEPLNQMGRVSEAARIVQDVSRDLPALAGILSNTPLYAGIQGNFVENQERLMQLQSDFLRDPGSQSGPEFVVRMEQHLKQTIQVVENGIALAEAMGGASNRLLVQNQIDPVLYKRHLALRKREYVEFLLMSAGVGYKKVEDAVIEAEHFLSRMQELYPQDIPNEGMAWAYDACADAHREALNVEESAQFYSLALRMKRAFYGQNVDNADVAKTLFSHAKLLAMQGKFDDATTELSKSIAAYDIHVDAGQINKEEALDLKIELDRKQRAYKQFREIHLKEAINDGDQRAALHYFAELIKNVPASANLYCDRAFYLHLCALRDWDQSVAHYRGAEEDFKKANRLDPGSEVLVQYAQFLYIKGDKEKAKQILAKALNMQDSTPLHYNSIYEIAVIPELQTLIAASKTLGNVKGYIKVVPTALAHILLIKIALEERQLVMAESLYSKMQQVVNEHNNPVSLSLLESGAMLLAAVARQPGANNLANLTPSQVALVNVETPAALFTQAKLKKEQGLYQESLKLLGQVIVLLSTKKPEANEEIEQAKKLEHTVTQCMVLTKLLPTHFSKGDLNKLRVCLAALIKASPKCSLHQLFYARSLHLESKTNVGISQADRKELLLEAERFFQNAVNIEARTDVLAEYGQFLFLNDRKMDAELYLNVAVSNEDLDSCLHYGQGERGIVIPAVQSTIDKSVAFGHQQAQVKIHPKVLAYTILVQVAIEDAQTQAPRPALAKEYLRQMLEELRRNPSAEHYNLLAHASKEAGMSHLAKASQVRAERLWQTNWPVSEERQSELASTFSSDSNGANYAKLVNLQRRWHEVIGSR